MADSKFNLAIPRVRWAFTSFEAKEPEMRDEFKYLCYQREIAPTTGVSHWQGYLELKVKLRLTGLKALGGFCATAHLEPAHGTAAENKAYCSKPEGVAGTFREYGVAAKDGVSNAYQQFCGALRQAKDNVELKEGFMPEYVRHKRAADEIIRENVKVPRSVVKTFAYDELHDWQKDVVTLVQSVPDDRVVHWYYDALGNRGKSSLAKYLHVQHDALLLTTTAMERVSRLYKAETVIVFDVERSSADHFNYDVLAKLKDQVIVSTMYDPEVKYVPPCHVLVFANFAPNLDKLSSDRWRITDLSVL